jgi:dCTP deaminase
MILCDTEIQIALANGQIKIEPPPSIERYTTTAVDLTLGSNGFKKWKKPVGAMVIAIDPSQENWYPSLRPYVEDITPSGGVVRLEPGDFILAITHERVEFPEMSRLAARVEGKSSLARIGLGVHVTAPTIHSGFKGNITLEIKNHGDIPINLKPGMAICQLIFEMVFGTPQKAMSGIFQDQNSVLGKSE